MKSKLFKTAWTMRSMFSTFGEALRRAWQIIKLHQQLTAGVVAFLYTKKDMSVRTAVGTLKPAYMPPLKGSNRPVNYSLLTYFDIEANDFRSAKVENLVFL